MVPPPDDDHDCGWKAYAKAQDAKLDELTAKLEELQRRVFGKSSERRPKASKLPPPLPATKAIPAETAKKRAEAKDLRDAKLETENVTVPVPPDKCTCPDCGNPLRAVGA